MESSDGQTYSPETLVYFRQKVNLSLEGIRLSIKNNHQAQPQFLEELQESDRRTGDRGEALIRRQIIMRREEMEKEDLEAALDRLDNGTFGICQGSECKTLIPFSRLDAIPQAKYCLACQVKVRKVIVPKKVPTKKLSVKKVFIKSQR